MMWVTKSLNETSSFVWSRETLSLANRISPITGEITNDALEFKYNDQTVAKFTNEVLEVRNIAVQNQIRFGDNWAIRPGAHIEGKGNNLNDVWIGG